MTNESIEDASILRLHIQIMWRMDRKIRKPPGLMTMVSLLNLLISKVRVSYVGTVLMDLSIN